MKTIFKVGMEVWDKTISPNKGKVIEVLEGTKFDFPIKVEFDDGLKIQYTNKGCFVKSKGAINTLSSSDYSIELEGFEQKAPATEFEEALEWLDNNENYSTVFINEKTYPSKEIYETFEALRKLIILRDYYNEGWQPDWKNPDVIKHTIEVFSNELRKSGNYTLQQLLVFKTKEIRNKFLEEQRELLEIAKPLL